MNQGGGVGRSAAQWPFSGKPQWGLFSAAGEFGLLKAAPQRLPSRPMSPVSVCQAVASAGPQVPETLGALPSWGRHNLWIGAEHFSGFKGFSLFLWLLSSL